MNAREKAKSEENNKELEKLIKLGWRSQRIFCDEYYREKFFCDAESYELKAHYERFKKRLVGSPERIIGYLDYVKLRMGYVLDMSESRSAAWEYGIELDTRIVTIPLPAEYGCEDTALMSIVNVIRGWREIVKKYGLNCQGFKIFSDKFTNVFLRGFTTKWHKKLSSEVTVKNEFRTELALIQDSSKEFLSSLQNEYDFNLHSPS